jgi:2-dehydro-3-deoxyphosphogluconate aldolase/(4S)-4-hydroxy-2-oxoglutarate aldolase
MRPKEQQAMRPDIAEKIDNAGVVAVLVIDEVRHAVPTAEALIEGGVDTIELTLRTPAALDCGAAIINEVPEITLGFGTVLTVDQVKAAIDVGADFAVAPGCNPKIIAEAIKSGISFAPGVMTASEIEIAVEHGCRVLKYFPAEAAGGMGLLKNMAAPYSYLDLSFIPLGGLNINNVTTYLESPLITAVGGSWIAKRSMIQGEEWETITENAKEIRGLINEIK